MAGINVTWIPLADRVLVKADDAEEKLESGIYLPQAAQEKPQTGVVLAAGPGKYMDNGTLRPMSIKEGDKVIFGKYSGSKITVGNDELLCMREDDIMAIEKA